jgi:NADPH:quinone reductase-like Zn-dependent oxidoreductase
VVTAAGPSAGSLKAKDTVLITSADAGTWQNNVTVEESAVAKIPEATAKPLLPAAITAALALQTANLQAGDVVLQNNGSSAVARAVAQLAKAKGAKVVSVVQGDTKGAQGDVVVSAADTATPVCV